MKTEYWLSHHTERGPIEPPNVIEGTRWMIHSTHSIPLHYTTKLEEGQKRPIVCTAIIWKREICRHETVNGNKCVDCQQYTNVY